MTEIPFHETRMGRTFYDHTLPKLVEQLERLNANLERNAEGHPVPPRIVEQARLDPTIAPTRSAGPSEGRHK
jgi:hypothetical protein